jgi:hypothetical protein
VFLKPIDKSSLSLLQALATANLGHLEKETINETDVTDCNEERDRRAATTGRLLSPIANVRPPRQTVTDSGGQMQFVARVPPFGETASTGLSMDHQIPSSDYSKTRKATVITHEIASGS